MPYLNYGLNSTRGEREIKQLKQSSLWDNFEVRGTVSERHGEAEELMGCGIWSQEIQVQVQLGDRRQVRSP